MPIFINKRDAVLERRGVRGKWSMISGDSLTELHEFAARLGLSRKDFMVCYYGHGVYVVLEAVVLKALRLGAVRVTPLEFNARMVQIRIDREEAERQARHLGVTHE